MSKLDKWMETAGNMASDAVRGAGDLVNKAGDKANELAVSAKISKMQRQLGALIYALRKNGEENEPMIEWYIAEIDRLKAQMPTGRAPAQPKPEKAEPYEPYPNSESHFYGADAAGDDEDAMFRGGNGEGFS